MNTADTCFLATLWQQVWQELQLEQAPPDLSELLHAYHQPQRHYHTEQHLCECLYWWQRCRTHMHAPAEVALALFYHDVVYDPKRHDNERQSAVWMQTHTQDRLPPACLQRIQAWIHATAHHHVEDVSTAGDLLWVLDIDLAILSADTERFQEYERQIRLEYRHVPLLIYRYKRRQVLRQFAQRHPLYHTGFFKTHLEVAAKRNLPAA